MLFLTAAASAAGVAVWTGRGDGETPTVVRHAAVRPAGGAQRERQSRPSVRHAVDLYAFDHAGMISAVARGDPPRVYVPNSAGNSVDVIDQRTFRIVGHFPVGALPQHVTPSYDLRRLYVDDDVGNTLTPIDPRTGKAGTPFPVDDPYNLYFTPDGRYSIVVAERQHRLDFRSAHTFTLIHSLSVPCAGVNHLDFSADGTYAVASCEFSGQLIKVDVRRQRVVKVIHLPHTYSIPQDVRASPDGKVFYVADLAAGGVWEISGAHLRVLGLLRTGAGAHGLVVSRNGRLLYVANRNEGSVSIVSFRTRRVIGKWRIPGGGSPDMGGVSADGRVLWLSGRYNAVVYAIDTRTGRLLARIPVGSSPHGLSVWPQPGRHSLGHTGNMR